jgi:hypothetical protein
MYLLMCCRVQRIVLPPSKIGSELESFLSRSLYFPRSRLIWHQVVIASKPYLTFTIVRILNITSHENANLFHFFYKFLKIITSHMKTIQINSVNLKQSSPTRQQCQL